MNDFTQSPGDFRYAQGHSGHQHHTAPESESPHDNYAHVLRSTAAEVAFLPWLMDVPTYTSPLSRTLSFNGSGYTSTPSPYTESTSMYHLVDQTLPYSVDYMARDSQYIHNPGLSWQPHLSGDSTSSSQQRLTQQVITSWQSRDYVHPSLPHNLEYNDPLFMDHAPSSAPHSGLETYHYCSPIYESTARPIDVISPASSSDTNGNSDSEYNNTKSNSSQCRCSHPNWSMVMDDCSYPSALRFVCLVTQGDDDGSRACQKRFARPEHLRRHVRTVHESHYNYVCKVPLCLKTFSRSDNLRDHYWTHLERGGRIGKNVKMSLAQLKEILGPNETTLVKKLNIRLAADQTKQRSAERIRQKSHYRSKF
jgi:hypothetical protein